MLVKTAPGVKVPREDDPRKYITDDTSVDLEMTAYYIRRMADGDLVDAAKPAKSAAAAATNKD
jgi:hypothetical protein